MYLPLAFSQIIYLPRKILNTLNKRNIIILIAAIVLFDQAVKFYVKLHFTANEQIDVFSWFKIHFVENPGMAWGWELGDGGSKWKIFLTLFRLGAVIWGTFLIRSFIKEKKSRGLLICSGLIYAGALGNLIDSTFYGLFFDSTYNPHNGQNVGVVAKLLTGSGYGSILEGKVVDMLYFPMFEYTMPNWGWLHSWKWLENWVEPGTRQIFFSPVFNIADASITLGVLTLFIFQNKFLSKPVVVPKQPEAIVVPITQNETTVNDNAQAY